MGPSNDYVITIILESIQVHKTLFKRCANIRTGIYTLKEGDPAFRSINNKLLEFKIISNRLNPCKI